MRGENNHNGAQFSILGTSDERQWLEALDAAAQHDFYHLPQYHRLAEERGEGNARLFVYRESGYVIALPLLLRAIDESDPDGWKDATSVYGYGGPVASHSGMPDGVVRNFQTTLHDAFVKNRVVAAFSRLHPLIPQGELLKGLGERRAQGRTVSIDLTASPGDQVAQYRSTARGRISKLRRQGIVCVRDEHKKHLPEFVAIYHETMRRVNAHESYFFENDYFNRLADGLRSKLQLFRVLVDGKLATAGLFTVCNRIVQYHLGGTRDEFLSLSATGLMFDVVRTWATESGARWLHLGGGLGSKEDSLFHFKAGFSDQRHNFATWRWIVLPETYRELCDERARANERDGLAPASMEFFPAYRTPTVAASDRKSVAVPAENVPPAATSDEDKVLVIGAGGHAKEVICTVKACGRGVLAVDDDPEKWGSDVLGVNVSAIDERRGNSAIIAIGNNARRKERATGLHFRWETIVHPAAWVAPSAKVGRGSVVFAGAVVQPDVVIGDHVIVNSGATISHDCVIGDFAHIASGAHLAGGVQVGEGAFIGIGSSVIQRVRIGSWTTVGAGAAVIENLPDGVVAVGVPARIRKL